MVTVGILSPGAMGSALGRAWRADGATVVTTVTGRSARTAALAKGLPRLAGVREVVARSDVVVSICPPSSAADNLARIIDAARAEGVTPLLAELNAISPALAVSLAARASAHGLDLVDGSLSGSPPRPDTDTLLYLSGGRAQEVAALLGVGLRPRVIGDRPGSASAVKMCTSSVYKGTTALWEQALETADAFGVLDDVVADLAEEFPGTAAHVGRLIALAASKSRRFVGEMEMIADTQGDAGASPELFHAMAAVYTRLSRTPLAALTPEQARGLDDLGEVLHRLREA